MLITRDAVMAVTASSRSASARTMAGALPPSSRFSLVMFGAAAAMIREPVPTLPVKLIRSMPAWLVSTLPAPAPVPLTTLNTPGGRSVSATSLANSKQLIGVSSLGLMTMVLPVISAGAILRAMRKNGKFHGKMPATTPSGLRSRKMCSLTRSLVSTSPSRRRAHSAM
ncbi:hypothetical protein D3C85_1226710 [compost metagenome]